MATSDAKPQDRIRMRAAENSEGAQKHQNTLQFDGARWTALMRVQQRILSREASKAQSQGAFSHSARTARAQRQLLW